MKQHVAAVLQVSILNGTDLKSMINYTGEQVSQAAPTRAVQSVGSRTIPSIPSTLEPPRLSTLL